ncbi:MAG TPA: beta-galactosidase small subunit, partial [Rariglobus sp.]
GLVIANDALRVAVDAHTGLIADASWQDHRILLSGPRLQVWRGATDNDGIKGWTGQDNKPLGRWLKAGLDRLQLRASPPRARLLANGSVELTLNHVGACAASASAVRHRHVYTIHPDGVIHVANTFVVDRRLPSLPRLGVTLALPAGFEQLAWYGRGPLENYRDRNRASMIDLHSSSVTAQYVPYIVPQEHGNHTDVRWVSLSHPAAASTAAPTLHATARDTLEFSASHFTPADLFSAAHTFDLNPRPETYLNLDYFHSGLGTGSCGPATLPPYEVPSGRHEWHYTLTLSGPSS